MSSVCGEEWSGLSDVIATVAYRAGGGGYRGDCVAVEEHPGYSYGE